MTKDELIQWLISKGYKKDTYGHYQKEVELNGKSEKIRYKIQGYSVRYERQILVEDNYDHPGFGRVAHDWIRLASGYFKDLSINDKNQLCGMKR